MPISYVASARTPVTYPTVATNTSDCVIAKPTGTVAGDVMVVYLETGSAATFSYPVGWREVANYRNTAANMTSGIAYKVAGASEATTYAFADNLADGAPLCGMVLTYRGVDTTDPIVDPVNAHGESDTGTTGTSAVAAPTVTSTALGWYVWFRAGKIVTTPPALNDFTITNGTARQTTANRGTGTGYFVAAADSNAAKAAGANTGATFTRTGSGTFSGSLARTIVLKQLSPPTEGAVTVSLGGVTVANTGTVHDDGVIGATLGGISVAAAGTHFPPAVGPLTGQLGGVTVAFAGSGVGGPFAASLSPVSVAFSGSVNPIGTFGVSLSSIVIDLASETRVFGKNVILVDAEKRALRITQDDTIPIYKSDVRFEELASPFSMTLGHIGLAFAAETTSGEIGINLASVGIDWDAQIIYGDFEAQLGAVTAGFTGGIIGGSLDYSLESVAIDGLANEENQGDFSGQLSPVTMSFTDSPAGAAALTLGGITVDFAGKIINGDFNGVQLGGVTLAFEAVSTTEDLLKYAANVGDGTNTSYTVTHSFSSRDVVVAVYDNATYEEVVPLTVHATTNTITVQFATAPSTDAYRVVVLYSSV